MISKNITVGDILFQKCDQKYQQGRPSYLHLESL